MARTRKTDRPIPEWVEHHSDEEIVEHFKRIVESPRSTYYGVGRKVIDMRKRLLKLLIDGLAAKVSTNVESDAKRTP